jgi:tight adherence protein B
VFGFELTDLAFMLMVAVAVGATVVALIFPLFNRTQAETRVEAIAGQKETRLNNLRSKLAEDSKEGRRKQIQESLKQVEDREKERKKKLTLRARLQQAGLDITTKTFWVMSAVCGLAFGIAPIAASSSPLAFYAAPVAAFVGFLGFPRWLLGYLCKRRQNVFLNDFADAIDVMVRGLKAGLPVSEAMKIISTEQGPPVGPEFMEVVEGQRVGISIDQGIERMVDRMPLPEVNFLGIVMAIQSKTGGNLSEALSNLSRVLRDRKKMKSKIRSISQEAKSSAAIIGSLPILLMGGMAVLNPEYMNPLFDTTIGNICLVGSAVWMTTGILVMRKMINFEI